MRLLFTIQALDLDDPLLSVYHRWVEEIGKHFESVEIICLKEGRHTLPANVHVHSLGKEKMPTEVPPPVRALIYGLRFVRYVIKLRSSYDVVFVHMNQEYVLLGGLFWNYFNKPIYLWRNHYAGSILTDIAVALSKRVICTSTHSYTAKFKRAVLMPVGVDTERFLANAQVRREPQSVLFFSRITRSKHPEMLIEALGMLIAKSISFIADIYGSALPGDEVYYENLKRKVELLNLHNRVRFHPGVTNDKAPAIFQAHDIFVNCSPSGMYDKVLFEAAASGCVVLSMSDDMERQTGPALHFDGVEALSTRLMELLALSEEEKDNYRSNLRKIAAENSLYHLVDELTALLYENH